MFVLVIKAEEHRRRMSVCVGLQYPVLFSRSSFSLTWQSTQERELTVILELPMVN